MLLLAAFAAAVAGALIAGRRFDRLAEIRLRAGWAALAALAIQFVVLSVASVGDAAGAVLHLASYALAGWFVFANRAIPGLVLIAAGGALNLIAIAANDGVMPASAAAMRTAGVEATDGFQNSAAVADPHMLFLGDVIPVPLPAPLGNVASVGDLVIVAGAVALVVACSSPRRRVRATS
ncbi:MAG TPA: DUF5317 domain-containing protein [Thermoleophilaceae bacterium]